MLFPVREAPREAPAGTWNRNSGELQGGVLRRGYRDAAGTLLAFLSWGGVWDIAGSRILQDRVHAGNAGRIECHGEKRLTKILLIAIRGKILGPAG